MNNYEINDLYNYGYKIIQNKDYFKFSLDSILLADFVKINYSDKNLLDLCTGNAPIPIILSSKLEKIVGIELQNEIAKLANESVKLNNITNIEIINDNAKNIGRYYKKECFDIITCNPPYFKYQNDSIVNDNMVKSIARHEIKITLEEIISTSYEYLKNKGTLYIVHHAERFIEIINLLKIYKFGVKRIQFAYNSVDSKCKIVLIEAMKNGKNFCVIDKPLITNNYRGEI